MDKLDSILGSYLERIQEVSNSESGLIGLPSGFRELDRITGGFEGSDLIVIGARPLMGKTIFLMQLMLNMTREYNIPVMFFSLDMSSLEFVSRVLSSISEIENTKFRHGCLPEDEWSKIMEASKSIEGVPLFIYDKSMTVEELCEKSRNAVNDLGVKAIFIDYLQLLSLSEGRENRYQDMAYCTRLLKGLAKELNVPVIVTSQLNRNIEYRPGSTNVFTKPELHDLRDSGTICEDANLVILLDRPELTQRNEPISWDGEDLCGVLKVVIAKNNNGREDVIKMRFKGEINKIEEWNDKPHYGFSSIDSSHNPDGEDQLSDFGDNPFLNVLI